MSRVTQDTAKPQDTSHKGLSPAEVQLSRCFCSCLTYYDAVLQPRHCNIQHRFGLFPVRSPLLGESLLFSLPAGTKMFQFPALAPAQKKMQVTGLQPDRLSHSEIRGSRVICTYPRLIAAYHVLHRLCEPRHPPCALSYFLLMYPLQETAYINMP